MMQYVIKHKGCRQMALKAKKSDVTYFEKMISISGKKRFQFQLACCLASVLATLPHFFRHIEIFNWTAC